jgi:hypothetical protein
MPVYNGRPESVAEMAAFDDLPSEVRTAINYAPLSFQGFTLQARAAVSSGVHESRVVTALRGAIRRYVPDWRPLRRDHRTY